MFGSDMALLDQALTDIADTGRWSSFVRGTTGLVEGLTGLGNVYDNSLQKSRERLNALDAALSQLVSSGKADQARAAFDRIAASAAAQGVSLNELKQALPSYAVALETTATATAEAVSPTSSLTGATKEYKTAADAAAAASRGQRDALVDLAAKMKAETDPVFGLLDAQQKLTEAQKGAATAVKEHGRNSDEAREATRKLALAAIELQSKAGELSGTFDGEMTPALRQTLLAAGLTERQVQDVAAQFRQAKLDAEAYDGDYRANASAPGATKADGQLKNAKAKADAFDGNYQALVSVIGGPAAEAQLKRLSVYQQALKSGKILPNFQGPIKGPDGKYYHSGGWTGPGGKYEEAGIVHADEYVIKKESRNRIEQRHPGLLDELNATGQLPGYAAGGPVRWPYPTTAAKTRIPSRAEAASAVMPSFGAWPSSPSAQRGDSGVWRGIVMMIRATGPLSGDFGNGYRPGDPKWHGSGRAVDWMGYNQDSLARHLAARRPLELIHRTASRDYAYTRGRNMGSFNEALMNAHRNHIHAAFAEGGLITEPVVGVGLNSGNSYSFAERAPEWVVPSTPSPSGGLPGMEQVVAEVRTLRAVVERQLVDAVDRVAPGVGAQLNGAMTSARQVGRAKGWVITR